MILHRVINCDNDIVHLLDIILGIIVCRRAVLQYHVINTIDRVIERTPILINYKKIIN